MVAEIASEYGHEVIPLPPYHPELNAVEEAWGVSKNYVAERNCPAYTFKGLGSLIEDGLNSVSASVWDRLDKHVIQEENKQIFMLEQHFSRLEKFAEDNPSLRFQVNTGDSDDDDDDDVDGDDANEQVDILPDDEIVQEIGEGIDGHDEPLYDLVASADIPEEQSPESQNIDSELVLNASTLSGDEQLALDALLSLHEEE